MWMVRGWKKKNNHKTIKNVTERSGISSVATAFDRYGHLYPNEDRELAERLSNSSLYGRV